MPAVNRPNSPHLPHPTVEGTEKEEPTSFIEKAAEVNEAYGTVEDGFWTAVGVVENVGKGATALAGGAANEARIGGAIVGAIVEAVHPTPSVAAPTLKAAAASIGHHAEGFVSGVEKIFESPVGRMAEKGMIAAGVASVAYNGYKAATDGTMQTTTGKVVAGLAVAGVAAAGFISGPIGLAVMGTEVITGGALSGSVKGMVAMGEGMLTGDHRALEKWKKDAKSGEHGWLVKAVANNKTASAVAGAVGTAVVGTVTDTIKAGVAVAHVAVQAATTVAHAAANLASKASDLVSSGWHALTSW